MTPILYITPNRNIIKKKLEFSDIDPENYCHAAEINIDTARSLKEWVNIKPDSGQKILILNLNKTTNQIQNALLKTIEECPDYVQIIIYCETLQSLLETIKSRCIVEIMDISNDPKDKLRTIKDFTDAGMSTKLASEELVWLAKGLSQSEKYNSDIEKQVESLNQKRESKNDAYRLVAQTAKLDIKEYSDVMRTLRIKYPDHINAFLTDSPLLYLISTLR